MQNLLVEEGQRQVFREGFLLDLEIRPQWHSAGVNHDKWLFPVSRDAADPDPMYLMPRASLRCHANQLSYSKRYSVNHDKF